MLYRRFGKTNEMVSVLGFGCMRLPLIGEKPANIDEMQATRMIRYAIDAGVNYVDTAYPYHGGASEPFVAKVLRDGYRQKVKLATKLPSWLIKSRTDMDKYLNEQLQRLNTECIDFYLVHSLDADSWPVVKKAGIAEFLDQAIRDGKIRYAGFSFHDKVGLFKEIVDYYDWSFCQIQYNYLDVEYQAGTEGLLYAAQKGLGIAIMEPLRGGNIIHLPPQAKDIFEQVNNKRTSAEWGLRWVWNHPEVSVVLSGMSDMEQVVENVALADKAYPDSLQPEELTAIDKVKNVLQARIKVNCTGCAYCMPCPTGINIPMCFSTYNDYWVFNGTPTAKKRYQFFANSSVPASKCVECGQCESHCPQGISIRRELKQVKELFE